MENKIRLVIVLIIAALLLVTIATIASTQETNNPTKTTPVLACIEPPEKACGQYLSYDCEAMVCWQTTNDNPLSQPISY